MINRCVYDIGVINVECWNICAVGKVAFHVKMRHVNSKSSGEDESRGWNITEVRWGATRHLSVISGLVYMEQHIYVNWGQKKSNHYTNLCFYLALASVHLKGSFGILQDSLLKTETLFRTIFKGKKKKNLMNRINSSE